MWLLTFEVGIQPAKPETSGGEVLAVESPLDVFHPFLVLKEVLSKSLSDFSTLFVMN